MAQLLLHLPDDLAQRFKQAIPSRQRSQFVQRLLEAALPSETDDPLYLLAVEVEKDETLNAEMAEWEQATASDGLEPQRCGVGNYGGWISTLPAAASFVKLGRQSSSR